MNNELIEYNLHFSKTIKLTFLKDWSFITVTGKDCFNYLQGQITYNLKLLKSNKHIICSHCTIDGKVLSILRLFMHNDGYAYILRKSTSKFQINELKKYSIFSHVNICQKKDIILLGIMGREARTKLLQIFKNIPHERDSVYQENDVIILKYDQPHERYLIIIKKHNLILNKILSLVDKIYHHKIWLALEIASNFPIIDYNINKKFFPQSLNLEKLNGLDLKKGCYYGQEMIAKIHFKKLNKHYLHWLSGYSYPIPKIGDNIEQKKNKNFSSCGWILSVVKLSTTKIWIQAVLKHYNHYKTNVFRIKNKINSFFYITDE
ncbi:conserved hypothetical protein [Buchnera aphidicola str. Bp (Baizongia pistaciae)]|uniref:tRNA-modifying protein YgfZ n=1 Tax=Buchnera aphidicola subsp. Baizongia pistaciae (strain Bp) TaxID=224915 RepID=YGFZ_BUCBP|nr:tRNA-modifying protein YgfZ [Buchnera aphidicola]Q89AC3.1 RecName: Full=tRNA-modifying protein YgfZ [Buchnera aphidicola str. Bp (Baizongia pistaciae)]AAO27103.1 conserved hypothetical protein [Buchnera aphidicola str. Bp (Baizongia pistaciae)]